MKLRASPETGQIYLDAGSTRFRFDGTPLTIPTNFQSWPVVGEVPCLFDWQEDPGRYGPYWATFTIAIGRDQQWTAGGSILYIRSWITETEEQLNRTGSWLAWLPVSLWIDRNTARANAQVQW